MSAEPSSTATVPPSPDVDCRRSSPRAVVLEDVFVNWWRVPTADDVAAARKRRGPATEPDDVVGRLVDVSATGSAVVAPADDSLVPGATVRVRLGRALATVRVAHTSDLAEPGWRLYGCELVQADAEFRAYLRWWLDDLPDAGGPHTGLPPDAVLAELCDVDIVFGEPELVPAEPAEPAPAAGPAEARPERPSRRRR